MLLHFTKVFLKASFLEALNNIFNTNHLSVEKDQKLIITTKNTKERFSYPFSYQNYQIKEKDWKSSSVCITLPKTTSIEEFINKSNVLNTTYFLSNESGNETFKINNQSLSLESKGMNFSHGFLLELSVSSKSKEGLSKFYEKSIGFSMLHGCKVNLVPKIKGNEFDYDQLVDEIVKKMNEGKEFEGEVELEMYFYD
ncbi:hypothetical protein TUBRATIS_18790 [Tubulinosema ratisbonensis]|uniref:Uncharacterized protein n=1 Tax=Tubulinosema ratisbonensis TaxID=291195 RepID=A0A437AKD1_9MICR|nr:hypothetical protein TUBRATIS_18790 [Tubulinosema ratisbonensis]